MIRLLTLLTVEESGCVVSVVGGTSSVGEVRPRLEVAVAALALPKLSFHRDGFFVGADGGEVGVVVLVVVGGEVVVEVELRRLMIKGWGIAYIGVGSKDCARRDDEVVEVFTEDCLLSSRARDCEATASVFRVSSCGLAAETVLPPLPLRAPLLRRLVVEADRDDSSCGGSLSSRSSSPSS